MRAVRRSRSLLLILILAVTGSTLSAQEARRRCELQGQVRLDKF
jgi:hypothetical protein